MVSRVNQYGSVLTLLVGMPLAAQQPVTVDNVAPGITYQRIVRPAGPWQIHLVRVDRAEGPWTLTVRHAFDSLRGREATSAMASRLSAQREVPVALNADFFDLRTGEVTNNQVIDGEVWKGIVGFDLPRQGRRIQRGQFAIDADGTPIIAGLAYEGRLRIGRLTFVLDGVNARPSQSSALVSFDARWGTAPVDDSTRRVTGDTTIHGRRLVAYGAQARARLDSITRAAQRRWWGGASRLRITHRFVAPALPASTSGVAGVRPARRLAPRATVGGWPILVRDSVSLAPQADSLERTAPAFSAARHPRSAIGTSEGGRILWLIAVDGRQTASAGMTLVELAELMRELGITEGLNLDGGGSTALWVGGQVRNRPSDPTGERPVGNAVMIVRDGPQPVAPRAGRRP
ncbi:MAG: phosphodiester glycosidase family protein [Gemmatimonadaceae bacterium]